MILAYMLAAQDLIERANGITLQATVYDEVYRCFPTDLTPHIVLPGYSTWVFNPERYRITLTRYPVQSIASVKYYDDSNNLQTVDPATYTPMLSTNAPAYVCPVTYWPMVYPRPDAVTVRYTAGLQTCEAAKHAVKLVVGHWYMNRETVVTGTIATELPMAAKHIIEALRYE
jgi:hypothetical protein